MTSCWRHSCWLIPYRRQHSITVGAHANSRYVKGYSSCPFLGLVTICKYCLYFLYTTSILSESIFVILLATRRSAMKMPLFFNLCHISGGSMAKIKCPKCGKDATIISFGSGYIAACCGKVIYRGEKPKENKKNEEKKQS